MPEILQKLGPRRLRWERGRYMLKNVENLNLPYQFKTRCYGDSHSYKTAKYHFVSTRVKQM